MIRACSHLVLATEEVPRLTRFFSRVFSVEPHFANDQFSEFVLPSRFRVAFFRCVGKAAQFFTAAGERGAVGIGVTVEDVDALYRHLISLPEAEGVRLSGPPKDHPWGERSFLFCDPDGNRWEVVQSPSPDGLLVNRE